MNVCLGLGTNWVGYEIVGGVDFPLKIGEKVTLSKDGDVTAASCKDGALFKLPASKVFSAVTPQFSLRYIYLSVQGIVLGTISRPALP